MRKKDYYKVEYQGKDNLSPAAKKAEKSTKELARANSKLKGSFGTLGVAARKAMPFLTGAAVIGGMTKMITLTAQAGDKYAKMSQKLGVAVETLSTFDHVAQLSGITLDVVGVGLRRFAQNALDMSRGIGEARREFEELGIEVMDSSGKVREMEDLVLEVADRFSQMDDGTRKTAMAMRLFGRSGSEMIPMLNKGREGLRGMMEEARDLGLVFSDESAKAMEEFNDNLTRLKGQLKGFAMFIGKEVVPQLSALLEWMGFGPKRGTVEQAQRYIDGLEKEISKLEKTISQAGPLIGAFMAGLPGISPGEVKEAEERLADLRAELRMYTQYVEHAEKPTKNLVDSMGNGADMQKEWNEVIKENALILEKINYEQKENREHILMLCDLEFKRIEQLREMKESWWELRNASGQYFDDLDMHMNVTFTGMKETVEENRNIMDELGLSVNRLSESFSVGLGEAVAGMVVEGRKFGDIIKGVMRALIADTIRAIVQMYALEAAVKAVKAAASGIGGFFGFLGFHEGGMIMHTGGMIKAHRGLAPDERPIIAQTREALLSRRGVEAVGGPEVIKELNQGVSIGNIIQTMNMGGIHNMADAEDIATVIGQKVISTIREAA